MKSSTNKLFVKFIETLSISFLVFLFWRNINLIVLTKPTSLFSISNSNATNHCFYKFERWEMVTELFPISSSQLQINWNKKSNFMNYCRTF